MTISALEFADNMLAATNPANLKATYQGFQGAARRGEGTAAGASGGGD